MRDLGSEASLRRLDAAAGVAERPRRSRLALQELSAAPQALLATYASGAAGAGPARIEVPDEEWQRIADAVRRVSFI